jgi:hypothetical protein
VYTSLILESSEHKLYNLVVLKLNTKNLKIDDHVKSSFILIITKNNQSQ